MNFIILLPFILTPFQGYMDFVPPSAIILTPLRGWEQASSGRESAEQAQGGKVIISFPTL